jgi:hypothetical protein
MACSIASLTRTFGRLVPVPLGIASHAPLLPCSNADGVCPPCSAAFLADERNTEVAGQSDIIGNVTWHRAGLDRSHTCKIAIYGRPVRIAL